MIWDTSIWRLGCSNRSKIRSAQKCYLCPRYVVSPMSPGRTPEISGAPGQTRTADPLLRRQMLYPTELRAHIVQLTHCTAFVAFFATGNCAGEFSLCPVLCLPPSLGGCYRLAGHVLNPKVHYRSCAWPQNRPRKKAVRSPATAAGSSAGAKCPPRGKIVQRWMLYRRSKYERGGSPSGTVWCAKTPNAVGVLT